MHCLGIKWLFVETIILIISPPSALPIKRRTKDKSVESVFDSIPLPNHLSLSLCLIIAYFGWWILMDRRSDVFDDNDGDDEGQLFDPIEPGT